MTNERALLKIKEQIDQAKTKVSELTGRENYLVQELEKNWEVKSVRDAKKIIKKLDSEIKTLDDQMEEGLEKVRREFDV